MKDEITAYHEAGHAVASMVLGIRFDHISIVRDEDSYGRVKRELKKITKEMSFAQNI